MSVKLESDTIGMLLTAGYILWTMQRVYLGKGKDEHAHFPDCNRWELISLVPMAVAAIAFGVMPALALDIYRSSTGVFLALFKNFV